MEEESFSYKTLRNSSYLFAGFLLPMAFTVFVTRAMTKQLGAAEYGIFLLANTISAFIGFVDLGLSTAITKYLAEYQAQNDLAALQKILSSGRVIFLFTGFLGLIIFLILGRWFLPVFNVPLGSVSHIFIVFGLAGLVFFFNSLNTIYNAVLTAMQRFDYLTKLSLANLVFTSIGSLVLLHFGFRLKAIMGLNALGAALQLVASRYYSHRLMPQLSLSFVLDKAEIKKAYKFGLLSFISNLSTSCLVYLDRLIIPVFLGPSQLAFYSIPGNVALKIGGVTNSLGGMFFPMASALAGSGEMARLRAVYIRAFRNLSVIAAAVTVAIIMFANKILLFWLGTEYAARGTQVLIILALTNYFIALYIPLQSMLMGLGKLKFLIRQSLIMSSINFILLLILVPRFGILGAAWAYLISILPMIFGFYWVEKTFFNISGQVSHYSRLYAKLSITGLLSAAAMKMLLVPLATNVWRLIIVGPLSILLYFTLYFIFRFTDREDEIILNQFFRKFLKLKN